MAKKGMSRPERTHTNPKNPVPPVPEIGKPAKNELGRPIPSEVYSTIDTDLARDNLENDIPAADLNEL